MTATNPDPVDPMERAFEAVCNANGIKFERADTRRDIRLDYYLPDHSVYVELKQFHSDRIAAQMKRVSDVIVIQGRMAMEAFAAVLSRASLLDRIVAAEDALAQRDARIAELEEALRPLVNRFELVLRDGHKDTDGLSVCVLVADLRRAAGLLAAHDRDGEAG